MKRVDGVGLALAGGGWRAFSQVAALEDMERNRVVPGAVAGTSMGSLVATLVAAGLEAPEVAELLNSLDKSVNDAGIVANMRRHLMHALTKQGFIAHEVLVEQVDLVLDRAGVHRFEDLYKPLAIVSVNLLTGDLIVFTGEDGFFGDNRGQWVVEAGNHDLATVIAASAAYPIAVTPVDYLGHTLVDGGCRMNLPTPLFDRSLVDAVVGVGMVRDYEAIDSPGIFGIMNRCMDYGSMQLGLLYAQAADVSINFALKGVDTFAVGEGPQIMEAARAQLAEKPVDWSPTRPSLFDAMRRAATDSVSRIIRAQAPEGTARRVHEH